MTEKTLQIADKLLFVRQLYDYCNRPTNTKIVNEGAKRIGITERSLREKMLTNRPFKGQELDIIEHLYLMELGKDTLDKQLYIFLGKMSDGDLRTIEKSQESAIKELTEQNEEMATSHIFNL
ncbi:hypothetical protein [Dyadobacter bucti]|uniref:hypothetical protein n=1 Tax=Dyadobacter bucti TaxID=2572203 RepID=UPI003F722150